jgi:hypothetical protein
MLEGKFYKKPKFFGSSLYGDRARKPNPVGKDVKYHAKP